MHQSTSQSHFIHFSFRYEFVKVIYGHPVFLIFDMFILCNFINDIRMAALYIYAKVSDDCSGW